MANHPTGWTLDVLNKFNATKRRQTDTPVQIRRARGALIRAKMHEDLQGWYIEKDPWRTKALTLGLEVRKEYAKAVCHALQWLLAP